MPDRAPPWRVRAQPPSSDHEGVFLTPRARGVDYVASVSRSKAEVFAELAEHAAWARDELRRLRERQDGSDG